MEPPILDWEQFRRQYVDLRFRALFSGDPGKRIRMKDLTGEDAVLLEYRTWVELSIESHEGGESERRTFFMQLVKDITEDRDKAQEELYDPWAQASVLISLNTNF